MAEHLREAIATTSGVHEMAVSVTVVGDRVLLQGPASTPGRRDAIGALVARLAPDHEVVNDIEVTPAGEPTHVEELF
jgi:osmotically-inducible protein OsmY